MVTRGISTAVPRLRLAEFRNDQGWAAWSLGELVEFSSGGTPSKADPSYWNGDIPWISASSMYEANIADSDLKVTSLAIGNGTRIASKGSLLVLVRGSMLFNRVPMGIAIVDVAFNQDVKALKIGRGINARFLLNQLIAISPRIPINETGIGAGKIETDTLANFPVYLPSEAEQQKIADCLTSLDEVIAAQGRKVEALKTHKRGLMQQLFPREGETRPRLRFPEFRDAPDWKETKLEALSESISSGRDKIDTQGAFDLYGSTGVIGKTSAASLSGKFILVARVGANAGLLTMAVGDFGVTDNTIAIILKHPKITDFVFCYLDALGLNKMVFGSGQPLITGGQLKELAIRTPHENEQQRIADCLSSLDTQITAESNQLASLKTHRRGLMQQLFPIPEQDS